MNCVDISGCWWYIDNNRYYEICNSYNDFDMWMEDFGMISGSGKIFVRDSCILRITKLNNVLSEYVLTSYQTDSIYAVKLDGSEVVMYRVDELFDSKKALRYKEFYDNYLIDFHKRMMINKFGMTVPHDSI